MVGKLVVLKRRWLKFAVMIGLAIALVCLPVVIQKAPRAVSKASRLIKTAEHSITWALKPSTTITVEAEAPRLPLDPVRAATTNGPLQVSSANPRYFTDKDSKIVYLSGSHTWANFQDNGLSDPPPAFDYQEYLDFLVQHNHNFFRLWVSENEKWITETANDYWFAPISFQRMGPEKALDGKPKYDLTKFNQSYFDRLRQRVTDAKNHGIYVSVMLFNGWSIEDKKVSDSPLIMSPGNPWRGHPLHRNNNVNGINGDLNSNERGEETHTLKVPAVLEIQKAYVRKVIDTVSDLDNVLYEVSNESPPGSHEWQYHVINFIKEYEATKEIQHPVGMTSEFPNGDNLKLINSPADWISPNGDISNRPITGGIKVVLSDTDHLCGICDANQWVWESFTRGENLLFMDYYNGYTLISAPMPTEPLTYKPWVNVRRNLGYALTFANRMNLATMEPRPDLSSTDYCLANASEFNAEYLVYSPTGGAVKVNLSNTKGNLVMEWFNPIDGSKVIGQPVPGGGYRLFVPPFEGEAVLYLKSVT